jgi:tRNA wybutosine-synthesizing protein 1
MACDFRFQKDALKGLNYALCGLGNSLYGENFNKVALELDKCLLGLQATRVAPTYCCDENTVLSKHSSLEADFAYWQNNFLEKMKHLNQAGDEEQTGCCKSNDPDSSACCKNQPAADEEDEEELK